MTLLILSAVGIVFAMLILGIREPEKNEKVQYKLQSSSELSYLIINSEDNMSLKEKLKVFITINHAL
jgi:MFS family permease